MDSAQIKNLLAKFRKNAISQEDRKKLAALLSDTIQRELLESTIDDTIKDIPSDRLDSDSQELIFLQILQSIEDDKLNIVKKNKIPVFSLWAKMGVAVAAMLTIFFLSRYFYDSFSSSKTPSSISNDVEAPKESIGTISFEGGKTIALKSIGDQPLILKDGVSIRRLSADQFSYKRNRKDTNLILTYNTITNPVGSMVMKVELSDGSHIWINAGSSITFPIAFSNKQRKVSMSGEVYFEVAHDARRPFIVQAENVNVDVLGTHFNVNTFAANKNVSATLLEGKIKISNDIENKIMYPGETAETNYSGGSEILLTKRIDTSSAVAWTKGKFSFDNMNVMTIMNQLKRWYGVDVIYESGYDKETQYFGKTPMNQNLSEVISVLSLAGLHCKLKNKIIYVYKN